MTYKTHRVFATFFILIGCMVLYYYNDPEVNYYLYLMIGLSVSRKGALFSDIDHHWESVKDKTVINRIINWLIRATGGKHRSRHTHSIDLLVLFGILFYIVPKFLLGRGLMSLINYHILNVLLFSFWLGVCSHLFSDMLTSGKVYLSCLLNIKLKLVPTVWFKGTSREFRFNTGGKWEDMVYEVVKALNLLVGIVAIIFPFIIN